MRKKLVPLLLAASTCRDARWCSTCTIGPGQLPQPFSTRLLPMECHIPVQPQHALALQLAPAHPLLSTDRGALVWMENLSLFQAPQPLRLIGRKHGRAQRCPVEEGLAQVRRPGRFPLASTETVDHAAGRRSERLWASTVWPCSWTVSMMPSEIPEMQVREYDFSLRLVFSGLSPSSWQLEDALQRCRVREQSFSARSSLLSAVFWRREEGWVELGSSCSE